MRYRKKPVEVEAFQWGDSLEDSPDWFKDAFMREVAWWRYDFMVVDTYDRGGVELGLGDYVVLMDGKRLFVLDKVSFQSEYEEVNG